MKLLVSGSTASMKRFAAIPELRPYLGDLVVPRARNKVAEVCSTGLPVYCDNGAFNGFDEDLYARMLHEWLALAGWVTMPDWVGNAAATAGLFDWWTGWLGVHGFDLADMDWSSFPMAFVAQDGFDDDDHFDFADIWNCGFVTCLFIGGTTSFKLSRAAADLSARAKGKGWWVHMGRVNSLKRIEHAHKIGCDSVDGSGYSKFADTYVPGAVRFLMQLAGDPAAVGVKATQRVRSKAS